MKSERKDRIKWQENTDISNRRFDTSANRNGVFFGRGVERAG